TLIRGPIGPTSNRKHCRMPTSCFSQETLTRYACMTFPPLPHSSQPKLLCECGREGGRAANHHSRIPLLRNLVHEPLDLARPKGLLQFERHVPGLVRDLFREALVGTDADEHGDRAQRVVIAQDLDRIFPRVRWPER